MTLSPKLQAALSLYTSNAASSPALGVSRDDFKASESHLLAVHRAEVLASLAGQTPEETLRQAVEACEGLRRAAGLQMNHIAGATIHVYLEAAAPILLAPERAKHAALTEQLREAEARRINEVASEVNLRLANTEALEARALAAESEVATLTARLAECEQTNRDQMGRLDIALHDGNRHSDRANAAESEVATLTAKLAGVERERIRQLTMIEQNAETIYRLDGERARSEAREAALEKVIIGWFDNKKDGLGPMIATARRLKKGAPNGD